MEQIIDLLNQSLKSHLNQKLILSISGGVDSMVLLHMLHHRKYNIEVVHFNHLKREQSTKEAEMVQTYCQKHHILFHYFTIDVGDSGNFHHQAHVLRKYYLNEVAKETKAKYIVTAHHLDDLFESILIKLTRGSNLLGYAGMQPEYEENHIHYLKPCLYTSKDEIKAYAIKHKVHYMNDESNEEDAYLRNRYRHAVVPIMKQENTQLLEQIKQYHLQVSSAFKFIRKTSISYVIDGMIDLETYQSLDPIIQNDIISYMLEKENIDASFDKITTINQMLNSKHPNQSYRLNQQFVFIKAYKMASIEPLSYVEPHFIELVNGDNHIENVKFSIFYDETPINTEDLLKLCYNELAFPLLLRHRLNGDILSYDYGHKKLKKLLIDKKVPMKTRDQLWVLTDSNNEILWVQNYYLNQTLGQTKTLYFKSKGE